MVLLFFLKINLGELILISFGASQIKTNFQGFIQMGIRAEDWNHHTNLLAFVVYDNMSKDKLFSKPLLRSFLFLMENSQQKYLKPVHKSAPKSISSTDFLNSSNKHLPWC